MAGKEAKALCKKVRPLMSSDVWESRRRVLGMYRAFYRYIPYIVKYFDIPKNEADVRDKIREYFYRNAFVTDVRVIDMLVLKGFMELKEIDHQWQQKGHIMAHWHPSAERKPCDFISKFVAGVD